MDAFRQWALCLIISAAAGTFVCAVSPRGSVEKAVRTVAGIFVVAAVCTPLTKLEKNAFDIPAFVEFAAVPDYGESLEEHMTDSLKKSISKQIVDVAEKYSVAICDVFVNAYLDEYNSIIIQDIQIEINSELPGCVLQFQSEAEDVLGVPISIRNGILM